MYIHVYIYERVAKLTYQKAAISTGHSGKLRGQWGILGGSRGPIGVILLVWSGPRDRPGKWIHFYMQFASWQMHNNHNLFVRSDFGMSTCWYYIGFSMVFWNAFVFADACFLWFLWKREGGKAYMGESHELKTVEIHLRDITFIFPYALFLFFQTSCQRYDFWNPFGVTILV